MPRYACYNSFSSFTVTPISISYNAYQHGAGPLVGIQSFNNESQEHIISEQTPTNLIYFGYYGERATTYTIIRSEKNQIIDINY